MGQMTVSSEITHALTLLRQNLMINPSFLSECAICELCHAALIYNIYITEL